MGTICQLRFKVCTTSSLSIKEAGSNPSLISGLITNTVLMVSSLGSLTYTMCRGEFFSRLKRKTAASTNSSSFPSSCCPVLKSRGSLISGAPDSTHPFSPAFLDNLICAERPPSCWQSSVNPLKFAVSEIEREREIVAGLLCSKLVVKAPLSMKAQRERERERERSYPPSALASTRRLDNPVCSDLLFRARRPLWHVNTYAAESLIKDMAQSLSRL